MRIIEFFLYFAYFLFLFISSTFVLDNIETIRFYGYASSFSLVSLFLYVFIVVSSVLIINKSTKKLRIASFILFLISFSDLANFEIQDPSLHLFFHFIMIISIILFIYSFFVTNNISKNNL